MLTDEELLRYSRQILLQQVDIDGQLKLKNSRVLIIGLGGLGSPVALYLAAAGVGELHLADFDNVDLTNLQRQIIHDTANVGESKVDSALRRLHLSIRISNWSLTDRRWMPTRWPMPLPRWIWYSIAATTLLPVKR